MGGRFFWASMSDFIGRKPTYMIFFALGAVLYALVPDLRPPATASCSSSWPT